MMCYVYNLEEKAIETGRSFIRGVWCLSMEEWAGNEEGSEYGGGLVYVGY